MSTSTALRVLHSMQFVESSTSAPFSGAENHVFQLLGGLAAAGADVTMVMVVIGGGPIIEEQKARLEEQGVKVRIIERDAGAQTTSVVLSLRKIMQQVAPQIVHSHLYHASEVSRIAARLARVHATVESVHNNDPALTMVAARCRMKAMGLLTSRYIAISEAVRYLLTEQVGLPARKVDVVRYGIDPPVVIVERERSRAQLGLESGQFVAGFVGRLTEQKNVEAFVRMVAALPEVEGVVLGEGEVESELHRLNDALGAQCRFIGYRHDAPDLMSAFDVLCLPSRWEGLGLVLLEAMARGVPVVGSTAGAIPEVLGDGRFGAVFPLGDQAAFEREVERCRADPVATALRARAAREHVRSGHSTEQMVKETFSVYERALSRPRLRS